MADGLLEDCRELLSRFESEQNVRFEVFSRIWREMNFSFIHCGKKDANGRIQIRMTLSMWKDFNELQELIQQIKHHDADFIIRSLKNSKAFLFCAAPTTLSYGSREAIICHEKENNTKISAEADKIIERTCGILERLHRTHMGYKEAKQNVMLLPNAQEYSRCLETASTSFDVDLASDIEAFHSWKQDHSEKFFKNEKDQSILMIADRNLVKKKKGDDDIVQDQHTEKQPISEVSRSMRHLKPSLEDD